MSEDLLTIAQFKQYVIAMPLRLVTLSKYGYAGKEAYKLQVIRYLKDILIEKKPINYKLSDI